MDLKDIKAIIDLMRKNSLSEFELERQDFKIKLKRGVGRTSSGGGTERHFLCRSARGCARRLAPAAAPAAAAPAAASLLEIKSPMIGTFYRAPSPESANYVEIGTEVIPKRWFA